MTFDRYASPGKVLTDQVTYPAGLPFPSSAGTLPVLLRVPSSFESAARYAIETLLDPLDLSPGWGDEGPIGLFYGPPESQAPTGWVRIPLGAEVAAFFEGSAPSSAVALPLFSVPPTQGNPPDGIEADLIAEAFYWLSGWDEHVSAARDRFGRSLSADSRLVQLGVECEAPVDAIRDRIADALREAGWPVARRRWAGREWALCPTHDVDYLRKWRPGIAYREAVHYLLRNDLGASPLGRVRRFAASARSMTRSGDPFRDAVGKMGDAVAARAGSSTWFFKAGAHGPHDVAYDIGGPLARSLVAGLRDQGHQIGLHPSFHAFSHRAYLREEKSRLEGVLRAPATAVRAHYLRFDTGRTHREFEAAGFRIDSTLGFSDRVGFRNGTCLPFRIFDHHAGQPSGLWEMPLALMESALFNRMGASPEEARAATGRLMDTARRHGGLLVALWHNTLWDEQDYPGWGAHFLETLDAASDGSVLSLADALAGWKTG